jgi:acetyltransferase
MRADPLSVARLFAPRSIAIIGASADPAKFSGRFVPYLLRHRYAGSIYPINARRSEIGGLPCYAELAAVPGDVDCVIYAAAAADAPQALAACASKKVRLIVMTSSGFAERGDDEGHRREAELVALARQAGARLLGPNCVGFLNTGANTAAAAAAAFEWKPPFPAGRIGVASQSGGLAMATIILGGWLEGIGFSHVVSTGNEADLDVVDVGRFLLRDDGTDTICLTLEAVRDGPAFMEFLADAQRIGKPVIALKTGRSELGKQMAASHTGALAGSQEVFAAVAARHGMTLVDDVDELWQTAQMFAKLRASGKLLPRGAAKAGDGCSAFSVSGGHIGLLADLAAHAGMRFPPLAAATQERLRAALGKDDAVANPVDMSGGSVSDHGAWARCLSPLLGDPAITVALPVLTVARNYDTVIDDLARIAQGQDKPVLVTWAGDSFEGEGKARLQRSPLPAFATPGRSARALVALDRWQRAREDKLAQAGALPLPPPHPLVLQAARAGRSALSERESKQVLAELGFPITRERLARNVEDAIAIARDIGYPVALKGEHPAIAHKTEAGVVQLWLRSEDALRSAYALIEKRMTDAFAEQPANGVLVAEMVEDGVELMMGAHRDPLFGPTVVFGLGGIFVEALQDARLALAPLAPAQARGMVDGLRAAAVLHGARGRHPADIGRIAELLCALGDFAAANRAYVSAVDINPLVLLDRPADQLRVLDALIVIETST